MFVLIKQRCAQTPDNFHFFSACHQNKHDKENIMLEKLAILHADMHTHSVIDFIDGPGSLTRRAQSIIFLSFFFFFFFFFPAHSSLSTVSSPSVSTFSVPFFSFVQGISIFFFFFFFFFAKNWQCTVCMKKKKKLKHTICME